MMDFFVGWDVGAWNCDKNQKSRDTLVVLTGKRLTSLRQVGQVWRGNVREQLTADRSLAWIGDCCDVSLDGGRVWIAIDTPLGWPRDFLALVHGSQKLFPVAVEAQRNSQLFRYCETSLPVGFRPLSAVKDQIGSQSSKGIYFLNTRRFEANSKGYHSLDGKYVALETYPTPTSTNREAAKLVARLLKRKRTAPCVGRSKPAEKDTKDALFCAVVAAMFRLEKSKLAPPPPAANQEFLLKEGWIWIPRDVDSSRLPKPKKQEKVDK